MFKIEFNQDGSLKVPEGWKRRNESKIHVSSLGKNIFLAPAGNEEGKKHLRDSVINGIELINFEKYFSKSTLDFFHRIGSKKIFVWGVVPNKENSWNKIGDGDYVLFYQEGCFVLLGQVYYKEENPDLAEKIWGQTKFEERWKFVIYLNEVTPIKVNSNFIGKLFGYKENWVDQGFQRVADHRYNSFLEQFPSIEEFIDYIKKNEI